MNQERADELYEQGLTAFRKGDNKHCIELTTASLDIGRDLGDDAVIGQALLGLCRAALRDRDEHRLDTLCSELADIADRTDDAWWRVVIAHLNAELARMNGDLTRAEELYDESMQLSESIGRDSMVATECFNKSFIAVEEGDMRTARDLLQRHFETRGVLDDDDINPYGLIAVATLLRAEGRVEDAAAVASACHRLLAEADIVPDPADKEPLRAVEEHCQTELSDEAYAEAEIRFDTATCRALAARFVG